MTIVYVASALHQPEPLSFTPTQTAQPVIDAPGRPEFRATIDAGAENQWRYFSLRTGTLLERPAALDWDLAFRRFHIATNGGPGFAGQGAAGVIQGNGEATALQQTSADSTKSGFGKWYNYGFSSHLLTPKPLTYVVHAADGQPYTLRILSYYCPGANPGCITIAYAPRR